MKKNQKSKISKLRYVLSSILLAAVLGVIGYIVYFGWLQTTNAAKDLGRPTTNTLIQQGAMQECETGDGGHGPDNSEPWYQVNLSIAKSEEDTIKLVQQVATENGYNLTHATVQNRGPLAVADVYVDKWYFDATSKKSDKILPSNSLLP